ncbi:MAG: molybdopterin molybdotransferase MoeA [Actinomycetota bacterium]|nr:molybdopterin molybdotransferase MoeA [Actinomycetota bacterium]
MTLKPKEALEIILNEIRPLQAVEMPLSASLSQVLAEDIFSKEPIPPFDNSAMDGYAVRFAGARGASKDGPVKLKVISDLAAGCSDEFTVSAGQAIRIMTGAPIPSGADTVVKQEDTDMGGDEVAIFFPPKLGDNIRLAGEDIAKGEKVLEAKHLLRPAEIGVLASLGCSKLKVFARPKVQILCTGDELIGIDEAMAPGKIRNSNAYSLSSQVKAAGAEALGFSTVRDDPQATKKAISEGLKSADVLIITGGVSVGDYDFVKEAMETLGAEQKFWKVAQRPGMPLAFWLLGGKPVFGLPGNPVSTMVCFEEYVRPALLKMMGRKHLFRPEAQAILKEDFKKKVARQFFVRVIVRAEDGRHYASLTGPQGSGILKSMTLANGLAVIPAETDFVAAGDPVKVHLTELPEDH